MASKQSAKGSRFEYAIRDTLTEKTGKKWERTPQSGGGVIKGDLFVKSGKYNFCFECKSYAEDHITSLLLHSKNPQLLKWWVQAEREAGEMERTPAVIFKKDRGKAIIMLAEKYENTEIELAYKYNGYQFYLYNFDEWIENNYGIVC
jgi:hypothetical protein